MPDERLHTIITASDKSKPALNSFKKGVQGIKNNLSSLGGLLQGGVLAGSIGKFVSAASDLQESTSKFGTVFRGVEKDAERMRDTLTSSYGLSERAAQDALSSFQDLLVPMGFARDEAAEMSSQFVKLGVDLGSFQNKASADVFRNLQSGMVGNTEALRSLGIQISAAELKQQAFQLGITETVRELSKQEKAMTILKLSYEQSGDAVGDFIRTSDGFANRLKTAQARLEDITAELGAKFLPVFNNVLDLFLKAPGAIQALVAALPALVTAFSLLGGPVTAVIAALGAITLAYANSRKASEEFRIETAAQTEEQKKLKQELAEVNRALAAGEKLTKKQLSTLDQELFAIQERIRLLKDEIAQRRELAKNVGPSNHGKVIAEIREREKALQKEEQALKDLISSVENAGTGRRKEAQKTAKRIVQETTKEKVARLQAEREFVERRIALGLEEVDAVIAAQQKIIDATKSGTQQRMDAELTLAEFRKGIQSERDEAAAREIEREMELDQIITDLNLEREQRLSEAREKSAQEQEANIKRIAGAYDKLLTPAFRSLTDAIGKGDLSVKAFSDTFRSTAQSVLQEIVLLTIKAAILAAVLALTPLGGGASFGTAFRGLFGSGLGDTLGFQTGRGQKRRVPGPPGVPVPIIAHGQEEIGRPIGGGGMGGNTIVIEGDFLNTEGTQARLQEVLFDLNKNTGLGVEA